MDPFTHGPLSHISQRLRAAGHPSREPLLPDVFAEVSPLGDTARRLLLDLTAHHHQVLADYLVEKLTDKRWTKRQTNQEAVKVILEESSIKAPAAAQHLGLAFCEALARIEAPWMRILTNLTMAELLSRSHVYAPSCAIAYLQTFRNVDTYLRHGLTAGEEGPSLFDPMRLADHNRARARELVLETVLPFGEDALRLLWGLQARAARDGDAVHVKSLRAEEIELARHLTAWVDQLGPSHPSSSYGWRLDLAAALHHSERNEGPQRTGLTDTPRARAVTPFLAEIGSLLQRGELTEAARQLYPLHRALAKDPERHFTTIRDHLLHATYLRAMLEYRTSTSTSSPCDIPTSKEHVRSLWRSAEDLFSDPSSLWSRPVMAARSRAIQEIPVEWRFGPHPFPI